jgi:hypothetical protein
LGATGATVSALADFDEPIIIRNCRFEAVQFGIELLGLNLAALPAHQPSLAQGVVIQNNIFNANEVGIGAQGHLRDILLAGNRIKNFNEAGIRFSDLVNGSEQIHVINNSLIGSRNCMEFQPQEAVVDVHIRNNLTIADRGLDMTFAGGDRQILNQWRIEKNWRQVQPPDPAAPAAKEWIPDTKDTVMDKIELLQLDPQHADFLRPAKGSPLLSAGAGDNLPSYVGAVPPDGVGPSDWTKIAKDFKSGRRTQHGTREGLLHDCR